MTSDRIAEINLDDVLHVSESAQVIEFHGSKVIFCSETGYIYGINCISEYIWESLKSGISVKKIISNVSDVYRNVPKERLQNDILNILTKLAEAKLLKKAVL